MVGVGMNLAAPAIPGANIEDTLVFASEQGMLEHDLRVLGVLVQWLEVHHTHVNADRLARMLSVHERSRVRTFWASVALWLETDRRLSRLQKLHEGARTPLLPVGTEFQVARRGEDDRFASTPLIVPAGTLGRRSGDVLSPIELIRVHAGYRNRVLMGPSWRADVWTVLETSVDLPTAEVARKAYCAFSTAWQVRQDFELLRAGG